jgi:hypothetical protein
MLILDPLNVQALSPYNTAFIYKVFRRKTQAIHPFIQVAFNQKIPPGRGYSWHLFVWLKYKVQTAKAQALFIDTILF